MKLRDYQIRLSNDATEILIQKLIVCLCMEVRTGKTLTALQTAQNYGAKNVLFVTKIKAFSSIILDYCCLWFFFYGDNNKNIIYFINACRTFGLKDVIIRKKIEDTNDPTFVNYRLHDLDKYFKMNFEKVYFENIYKLKIINKESLHKIDDTFDLVIYDEFHGFSAYPKASVYQKLAKQKYSHLPMILLSGTPTPESHSQWYHSFQLSDNSPFKKYSNFYKWAKDFVNVKTKHLGYAQVNDYSDADIRHINRRIKYYVLTFTQAEAGFTSTVNEMVLEVEMKPITNTIIERLKRDLVVKNSKGQIILADTGVKLMQKIHQLSSGTCKFEDGTSKIIDYSKAEFIKEKFDGQKIGIFYKFKEELNMLQEVLKDKLTTDLEEFNSTDKWIALQFISGREGLSLKQADYIVALNIDFSATTYFQFKDRMTTMERKENQLYWIFSKGGIEEKIYKTVLGKKDFTLNVFKKNYEFKIPDKNQEAIPSRRLYRH